MATLFNNSSGNFTTAATWSLVDATSYLNSEVGTTASSTTFTNSSQFTPGAITIDGIAIKLSAHGTTGTASVRLVTGGGAAGTTTGTAVTGTTVTINTADLQTVNTSTQVGWAFFKFSAPVLLVAATAYNVQIQTSSAAQMTMYRDATVSNWSRALRTTTTQAPASGDGLLVGGDYISAGVNNSYTVTNDNTATTTFGALQVCGKGTFAYGTAASTAYHFKTNNNLNLYTGGIFQMGTSGTPIPATSTAKLEFVNSVNVDFGVEVRIGSTFTSYGNVVTPSAFLAADASATATSLTTNVSTGWLNGDVIGIASTTRTRAESETKALTANASGTTLTITALTNTHSGTSPTTAELINLTRNVQVFGTSSTLQTYINIATTSIVSCNYTEFYFMGSSTTSKRGIDVATTTGSFLMNGCSSHDFVTGNAMGVNFTSGAGNNYTYSNNVLFNINNIGINQASTSASAYTISNNITMLTGSTGINLADLKGSISNLTGISSASQGISIGDTTGGAVDVLAPISGLTAHSNGTVGILLSALFGINNNPYMTFSSINTWRNTTIGIQISNVFSVVIDTLASFGNGTTNMTFGGTDIINVFIKNATLNAGTTLTCPIGLNITGDSYGVFFENSSFGATTTHATADIVAASGAGVMPQVVLRNTILNSTTPVSSASTMTEGGFIGLAKFQQIAGNHRTVKKNGTIVSDTVIFNSGPVSSRLTPTNANSNFKLQSAVKKFAVPSGQTATVQVFIRKSVVGDGSAYNGNQVRLILRTDTAAGVTTDTVLATTDNTYNGVFKALSGVTPAITDNAVYQVYVDCDGTAGWVNVDDWSIA